MELSYRIGGDKTCALKVKKGLSPNAKKLFPDPTRLARLAVALAKRAEAFGVAQVEG